jgi:hypothetical protein
MSNSPTTNFELIKALVVISSRHTLASVSALTVITKPKTNTATAKNINSFTFTPLHRLFDRLLFLISFAKQQRSMENLSVVVIYKYRVFSSPNSIIEIHRKSLSITGINFRSGGVLDYRRQVNFCAFLYCLVLLKSLNTILKF